jgi:hypothetical protein
VLVMQWRWWVVKGNVVEWLMWWWNMIIWRGWWRRISVEVMLPLDRLRILVLLWLAEDADGILQFC